MITDEVDSWKRHGLYIEIDAVFWKNCTEISKETSSNKTPTTISTTEGYDVLQPKP
jgi:hypothetical protein